MHTKVQPCNDYVMQHAPFNFPTSITNFPLVIPVEIIPLMLHTIKTLTKLPLFLLSVYEFKKILHSHLLEKNFLNLTVHFSFSKKTEEKCFSQMALMVYEISLHILMKNLCIHGRKNLRPLKLPAHVFKLLLKRRIKPNELAKIKT